MIAEHIMMLEVDIGAQEIIVPDHRAGPDSTVCNNDITGPDFAIGVYLHRAVDYIRERQTVGNKFLIQSRSSFQSI